MRKLTPHILWVTFLLIIIIWFSWFFRFSHGPGLYYLDRWRGELVDPQFEIDPSRTPLYKISIEKQQVQTKHGFTPIDK